MPVEKGHAGVIDETYGVVEKLAPLEAHLLVQHLDEISVPAVVVVEARGEQPGDPGRQLGAHRLLAARIVEVAAEHDLDEVVARSESADEIELGRGGIDVEVQEPGEVLDRLAHDGGKAIGAEQLETLIEPAGLGRQDSLDVRVGGEADEVAGDDDVLEITAGLHAIPASRGRGSPIRPATPEEGDRPPA